MVYHVVNIPKLTELCAGHSMHNLLRRAVSLDSLMDSRAELCSSKI